MVTLIKYTLAATLAFGAANAAAHNHQHRHLQMHALSKVENWSPNGVQDADDAVETVYELNGHMLSPAEATEGLQEGKLVIVSVTDPSSQLAPPRPAQSSSSSSKEFMAQFIEIKTGSSSTTAAPPSSSTSSTSSTSSAITSSAPTSAEKLAPTSTPSASPSHHQPSTGATGLNADFPSGTIPCSEFPSQYGAVPISYLGLDSWTGLQCVSGYTPGGSGSISEIVTGVSGQTCTPGCMCSYACPPGYQKTQWPLAQGSTLQSIGGLYCNSDGFLELTRPESSTICEPGVGGVYIQNDLSELVSTCRTDYPGTESMTIPAVTEPGERIPLCNPDQNKYYIWDDKPTSAQYYVNNAGLTAEQSCVWNSPTHHDSAGNWAPLNIGVGMASDGITYISLFANTPTSHAELNFNIEITGDVNTKCSYIDGKYSGGGHGCTTGMPPGGQAVIRYFK